MDQHQHAQAHRHQGAVLPPPCESPAAAGLSSHPWHNTADLRTMHLHVQPSQQDEGARDMGENQGQT